MNTEGKYRLAVTYQNGCVNRYYFNVFRNNLDLQYTTRNVVCETEGNITVTGLGNGYGYQLFNLATNAVEIPFSANNGPSFDFTTNGAYRVEVTQLNPLNNEPIPGACIFSTPDIGILNRELQVDIITQDANCNGLGSVQVNANNVLPNYEYELRLDDGTPPPASPSYPNHPGGTLVDSESAQPSNTHSFNNINPGAYFVVTKTDDGCVDVKSVTITRTPNPVLSALTTANIGCSAGTIDLTRTGGQGNPDFLYAIWSKDGTVVHSTGFTEQGTVNNIDPNAFQVETTFTFGWRDTDDDGVEEYIPGEQGTYQFIVVDANNCYAISSPVTITDDGPLQLDAVTEVQPSCSGDSNGELTLTVSGGTAPYQYSIDNGTTYQPTSTFAGLASGTYRIRVTDSSGCDITQSHNLTEPFPLSASAGVSRDATCDPNGAEVRVTNVEGGSGPYTYSFDGGTTYGVSSVAILSPGDYVVLVKDDFCSFPMNVTVDDVPPPPLVTLTPEVSYNCDGTGTITASPDISDYNYRFALDGVLNAPDPTSNVFATVSPGTYTVSTFYSSQVPPTPSLLLSEDFGVSSTIPNTIPSPNTTGYFFEDQTPNTTPLGGPRDSGTTIQDGEYAVTNRIVAPFASWISPNDQEGIVGGRYLAINVGSPGVGQALYIKTINDIIPNRPITVSLWAINLLRQGASGLDPSLTIELRALGSGNVVASLTTSQIPKNNGTDDWVNYTINLDPGSNTALEFVLLTQVSGNSGNDIAIDNINVFQVPEVCERFVETPVTVEAARIFTASATGATHVSCHGLADGTITFEVENFNLPAGFEYSENGGANWITATSSPITTNPVFGGGSQTVLLRKADEITCTISVTRTITEPNPLVATATIRNQVNCTDGGTITAAASGGSPLYDFQLEDAAGIVIGSYDFANNGANTIFSALLPGDYIVRTRDRNGCEDAIDAPLTLSGPDPVAFTLTPTSCYSGTNDGSVQVDVTSGNGGYEFRLDGGPWITPIPASATSYTFNNLSDGTYNVEVRDALQCPATANVQTATLAPQLVVSVEVVPLSNCSDGEITVNATGGNGILLYAIVPANTDPSGSYGVSNTLTVTSAMAAANPAGYDVYVQDNNGAPSRCTFSQEDLIFTPVAPLSVSPVPTDPECYNGLGQIDITVGGGTAPYTYMLVDLSTADGVDYGRSDAGLFTTTHTFGGIGVGDYEVTITDTSGCTITSPIFTINNAVEITADINPILPATCNDPDPLQYGFVFDNSTTPAGTQEYSADHGTSWQVSNELRGYASGTEVFPSIRVEVSPGVYCQRDFDRYIIPFPLDDLDITLSAVIIGCNDLRVTVEGSEGDGTSGYDYTYTDDPANFNTFSSDPNVWVENIPSGTSHTFQNIDANTPQYPEVPLLVPGRTYVFYVRDGAGCIRQSNENVNDIPGINLPIEVSTDVTPTCDAAANGAITFNLNPSTSYPSMRWELFELGNTTPIDTSGGNVPYNNTITTIVPLDEGDYYLDIIQVDGANVDACRGASENVYVPELAPLAATATATRDIACNLPGLISITGISGGGGAPYSYDVSGPAGFTPLTGTTDTPVQIPIGSPAGDYTVTLYDQYQCFVVLNTVTLAQAPNPTLTVSHDHCTSPITVNAAGTSAVGNVRYALVPNGAPIPSAYVDNGGQFNNVAPGLYDIYVIDGNGCTNAQMAYVVDPVLSARASLEKLLDCSPSPNADISIAILNGSGTYEYSITNTAGAPAVSQTPVPSTNFVYSAPLAGDYTIIIYDDSTPNSAACNREFTVTVPERIVPIIDPSIQVTDSTCLGENDGTITISTANSNAAPFTFEITSFDGSPVTISPSSSTSTSATFTGLAPTTTASGYIITVTGDPVSNGCSVDSGSITIAEPSAIAVTMAVPVEFGCAVGNNRDNASISVQNAVGGSNNFVRYRFFNDANPGTPVQDGPDPTFMETNRLGGTYTIEVYDDKGCRGTATASIAPFTEISAPMVNNLTAVSCNPGQDAQISVAVSVDPITASPNLEYVVTGINTVYSRTVTSSSHSENFTALGAGNYSISITNVDTGCIVNTVHTVEEPPRMGVVATKIADNGCAATSPAQGSFSVAISTYSGPYTYQVFTSADVPVAGQSGTGNTASPLIIDNLTGNAYYIRIDQGSNAPSCVVPSNVITILEPESPLSFIPREERSVSCSNDQGSILIRPRGGKAPYAIGYTSSTGQTGSQTNVSAYVFNGLSAGDYQFTVTDAFGCDVTQNIRLIRPEAIDASITATALVCSGDNDASVTASVGPRNVTPVYAYQLNLYADMTGTSPLQTSVRQSSPTFIGLGAGYYSITVTDDTLCVDETDRVQIVDPVEVVAQLIRTRALGCIDTAELELRATGGTGPYLYSEDGLNYVAMNGAGGPGTHRFTGLGAGTYRYYVQDALNCTSILSNEITEDPIEPLMLTTDVTSAFVNCTGERTAVIFADATGGQGNYSYSLYTDSSLSVASRVQGPKAIGEFNSLASGIYFVDVVSGDCTTNAARIEIVEPQPLSYVDEVINVTCEGESDGQITVTLSGGAGGYQYSITPFLNQFDTVNQFTGLAAGEYSIIAQDQNGCFEFLTYTIAEPVALTVVPTATPEICVDSQDGAIRLDISGGTAPYSTAINANGDADFVQDRIEFLDMAAGNYLIFVRDANGCEINTIVDVERGVNLNATVTPIFECTGTMPTNYLNITLEDETLLGDVLYALDSVSPEDFQLTPDFRDTLPGNHFIAIAHTNGCLQTIDFVIEAFEELTLSLEQLRLNEITATASGGKEAYTYFFDGIDNGNDPTFNIFRTDTYEVRVVDENGCEAVQRLFMEFIDIEIPRFFTPDGDGLNDFWRPRNTEVYPNLLTIIFDRYGREIYRMGRNDAGWGGLYKETELPTGDYWYILKLKEPRDDREFTGHFTLYR